MDKKGIAELRSSTWTVQILWSGDTSDGSDGSVSYNCFVNSSSTPTPTACPTAGPSPSQNGETLIITGDNLVVINDVQVGTIVQTDDGILMTAGTQFVVYTQKARPGQKRITWVIVTQGSVRMRAKGQVANQGVVVAAGMQTWVLQGQTPATPVRAIRTNVPAALNLPLSLTILSKGTLSDDGSLGLAPNQIQSISGPVIAPTPTASPTSPAIGVISGGTD